MSDKRTGSSLRALSVFDSALLCTTTWTGMEYEYNVVSPVDKTASPDDDDDESCVRSKKASLTLVVR